MADQAVVLVDCEKLRYRLFDFGIRQTGGDIFRHDPMECQKVVKLPEGPDPGFCDMNGGGVVVGCEIYQMPVTNPFYRPDSLCFQEVVEFVEPDG